MSDTLQTSSFHRPLHILALSLLLALPLVGCGPTDDDDAADDDDGPDTIDPGKVSMFQIGMQFMLGFRGQCMCEIQHQRAPVGHVQQPFPFPILLPKDLYIQCFRRGLSKVRKGP